MSDRFHINPETGNPGICRAKYSCRFGSSDEHFDSKPEARAAYEKKMNRQEAAKNLDEVKVVKELKEQLLREEESDFNSVEFALKAIEDWPLAWAPDEKENLLSVIEIKDLVDSGELTDEKLAEANKILEDMHNPGEEKPSAYKKDDAYKMRGSNIVSLAEKLIVRKLADEYPESNAPERDRNTRVIGLEDAQRAALKSLAFHKSYDGKSDYTYIQNNPEDYLDKAVDRVIAGEEYSLKTNRFGDSSMHVSLLPDRDRLFAVLTSDNFNLGKNQIYLATVFPDKELKAAFDKADIHDVSVSSFENGRENGLAYTTMAPDGTNRTFSVYEHRNSDSIIINGKTDWEQGELPYSGDSKNSFFAEFAAEDKKQAADALAFFIKEAQKGEIPSDEELASRVERRDWTSIIEERIPGYKDWVNKTFPNSSTPNDPRILGL